ncbi:MAG: hypothetical protein ACRBCS_10735 [Cellvibrionaceae bacterium]
MIFELPPGLEKKLNRASMKKPWINRLLSFFFMPLVHKSGLKINFDPNNYFALLPKKRFNINWYGTVAGSAILGNSELAAGSYLFMLTKGNYRMICKQLEYKFLLPSTEDIIFKTTIDEDDLNQKVATGEKFNISMTIKAFRAKNKLPGKRIGSGIISFHVWPLGI